MSELATERCHSRRRGGSTLVERVSGQRMDEPNGGSQVVRFHEVRIHRSFNHTDQIIVVDPGHVGPDREGDVLADD
ncbi:MAG: hypothetical protein R2848_12030 [Thermomicrobiales bacterium]